MKKTGSTSWGGVAEWYGEHVEGGDTYHAKVVAPNLARMLHLGKGETVVEIGCGEGYFSRMMATEGAIVDASDIAPELIELAKKRGGGVRYHVAPAHQLSFAKDGTYDVAVAALTLQNMERIELVCKEVARVLTKDGRFVCVLNHPAFRVPKRSSWGWDERERRQFRRIDGYLTASKEKIDMTPGAREGKEYTYSYHRSLQDHMKALAGAGLAVTRIEEWISHRESGKGPRKEAEDAARKEFPLFLAMEALRR